MPDDLDVHLAVLRAQFEAHVQYAARALELQAQQYQQRLDTLAAEQDRLAAIHSNYANVTEKALALAAGNRQGISSVVATIVSVLAGLSAVTAIVVALLHHQ